MLKQESILKLFLFLALILFPTSANSVGVSKKNTTVKTAQNLQHLSKKNIEKKLGRKLKLKERISFWILKKKFIKTETEQSPLPKLALIFSISAIIPFVGLGFGLIGIILGILSFGFVEKSEDKKKHKKQARLAIILGLLLMAISLLFTFALAINM